MRLSPTKMLMFAALLSWSETASAFCGFYVAGADKQLYNNATMVTMMRRGTTTVLSMQNNYEGPVEEFAMVVPVPVVLSKDNVKTLPREIFERVDKLTAPRLVEYWEQDPCPPGEGTGQVGAIGGGGGTGVGYGLGRAAMRGGVVVEAKFAVGEYDIVILSAKDATGLEGWLHTHGYKIPAGAAPTLAPYVQSGSKFFVAKVNPNKVQFEKGMANLSPLRFHYPSEDFSLPIRLGLINSKGVQDLLVHILADRRYELANYPNVTVPTNLIVSDKARDDFGAFYAALFDATVKENPGAVVTEYSWSAGSCDPCPVGALNARELFTLGLDVSLPGDKDGTPKIPRIRFAVPKVTGDLDKNIVRRYFRRHLPRMRSCYQKAAQSNPGLAGTLVLSFAIDPNGHVVNVRTSGVKNEELEGCMGQTIAAIQFPKPAHGGLVKVQYPLRLSLDGRIGAGVAAGWVLTRLHLRYTADSLGEDLVFRAAGPIAGGRGSGNELSQIAQKSGSNNFQARYIIRHPWQGEIKCDKPIRGRWGGPTEPGQQSQPKPALDLAFAPRGKVNLASLLRAPVPALALAEGGEAVPKGPQPTTSSPPPDSQPTKGCGCRAAGSGCGWPVFLAGVAILLSRRRRRGERL